MERLFSLFSDAIGGAGGLALLAAFVWGVLSMLLSPCHLASIPLVVGFIDSQGRVKPRRAALIAALFASGLMVTIAVIGLVTACLGRMMGDVGAWGNYFVAAIFLAVGLYLFDVLPSPWNKPGQVNVKRRGLLAALILGLVFGVALGPCTFAFMAPVLGVVFKSAGTDMAYGILLLLVYALGHCSLIVLAGAFTSVVQRYLNWAERTGGANALKRVCGVLVIAAGLYLIYKA